MKNPKTKKPAEAVLPGEILADELRERGWTQKDFAGVIGRPLQAVNEILNGKKRITADTAKAIAAALGTSAELWINLQSNHDLWSAPDADTKIARRAQAMQKV